MRRFALIFGGLAFFWSSAVSFHVLRASSRTGLTVSAVVSGLAGDPQSIAPPLASANGVWVTSLLLGVSILAGVPLGVALAHPPLQRITAWTIGLILLGFCFLAGPSLGLPYLPSAILVLGAGAMARVEGEVKVFGWSGT